ncbi:MAG: UDP-N-acetylmuramyl tripeptide synthetase, partial [Microbacteriaceae bacterium]|nr:UDP-N-acetylmuramyl tripeptide synthetase [Microbacteriaceae bacterium]
MYFFPVLLGRLVRVLTRLRGGGSALPGWVLLKFSPDFLRHAVERLPLGVVVVTGSNGKSTTTNMLATILKQHGLSVFTNSAGGNVPQGIASGMLSSVGLNGRLRQEIAVLEIDEGHGPALVTKLRPSSALLLNIQIDQLYRFAEPDRVYGMLRSIASSATEHVVVNASDENLSTLGAELAVSGRQVQYFSVAESVLARAPHGLASASRVDNASRSTLPSLAAVTAFEGLGATISVG